MTHDQVMRLIRFYQKHLDQAPAAPQPICWICDQPGEPCADMHETEMDVEGETLTVLVHHTCDSEDRSFQTPGSVYWDTFHVYGGDITPDPDINWSTLPNLDYAVPLPPAAATRPDELPF